jgi:hypothetical protein
MKSRAQLKDHILSARFTAQEWGQLESLWNGNGLNRGEWCRKVLLQTLASSSTTSAAEAISDLTVVLAEVLASRTIMINLLHTLGRGNGLPAEEVRTLIERADTGKLRRALDRLQQLRKGSKEQAFKPDR